MDLVHYGPDLARIHHERFGWVARAASRDLIARLRRAGVHSGTVVDLAAGSGILSAAMVEAGFRAWGVDISPGMLRIARAHAKGATFVEGSLWSVELPRCVAVAAVGEAFSYAVDPTAGLAGLRARLSGIHDALAPDGVLLFDVAAPGRSGPDGARRAFWTHEGVSLGMEEHEEASASRLVRVITLFVPDATRHRRLEETHVLCTYAPDDVAAALTETGFSWERLARYDDCPLPPGWHAWAATKAAT